LIGRDEHADIALFRDMKVEKKHCYIKQVAGKYYLVNNGAPPEFTRVNDAPVAEQRELGDGDRIQLGSVILKFQLRAAILRDKAKRLPVATPSGT
jgi:predicted component of type VI protein secretion system